MVGSSPFRSSSRSSAFYEGGVGVVTDGRTPSVQETAVIVDVLNMALRSRDWHW